MGTWQTGNLGGVAVCTRKHYLEAGDEETCGIGRLKECERVVTYNKTILAVIPRTDCTVF